MEIGELGGIELMGEMLLSDNGDVQRNTCLALNEACLKNTQNSQTFCQCTALSSIMQILNSDNTDLQTQALAVLGTSAVNSVEVRDGDIVSSISQAHSNHTRHIP